MRALPPVPYEELPSLAARATVLVMPYADLPVTRAMQPLKLKEYLATGKPVVVRALPATGPWADCLDAAVADQDRRVLDGGLSGAVDDTRAGERFRGIVRREREAGCRNEEGKCLDSHLG